MSAPDRRRARLAVYLPALALWCAASFLLSSFSDPSGAVGVELPLDDKTVHGIEYAVGGFLGAGVVHRSHRIATWSAAVVFCLLWGISDEIHQSLVPGRDPSGMDLAADGIGAAVGAAAFVLVTGRAQPAARRDDESGTPANHGERHDQARG